MERVKDVMREVLRAICVGGLPSKGEIAEKAGVQESTLESILSLLSSKGYLKKVESTTDMPSGCKGCPMSGSCMTKIKDGKVYLITEKGERLLSRR